MVTDHTPSLWRLEPICTVAQIVAILENNKRLLRIPPKYMLMWNEPWDQHETRPHKNISGLEGAEIWRLYLQPAAEAAVTTFGHYAGAAVEGFLRRRRVS